jgi:hypothetical protein
MLCLVVQIIVKSFLKNCILALLVKKIAAILLVLLLSFNFVGYRLYFYFLQKKADTTLVAQLDAAQYNEADLITLRVPLNMPYQTYQTAIERVDGEINVDGTLYKYVKRKVERGTLILWCLPHNQKMQLEDAQHKAFKLSNDVPASEKGGSGKSIVLKNILSDYDRTAAPWSLAPLVLSIRYNKPVTEKLFSFYLPTAEHPPQVSAA